MAFLFPLVMALPQHLYRDPCEVLEAKQRREQRERRRVGEEVSGKRWISAREALERLFDLPKNQDDPDA